MIKTILGIEENLKLNSKTEKFNFEASLMRYPVEMKMSYAQLTRFVVIQSVKVYLSALRSACLTIIRIISLLIPVRK